MTTARAVFYSHKGKGRFIVRSKVWYEFQGNLERKWEELYSLLFPPILGQ